MHFGLSEEQVMLEDMLNRYLVDTFPLDAVRDQLGRTCSRDAWQSLVDLGVCGLLVSEEFGGSQVSFLHAHVVAEQMGRAIAPLPYLGSVIVAPMALRQLGDEEQQQRYLPNIAHGTARFGVSLSAVSAPRTTFTLSLDGKKVSGRCAMTVDALDATHFLLAVDENAVVIIPSNAAGITVEFLTNVDKTRSYAVLTLDAVEADIMRSENGVYQLVAIARVAIASDSFGAAQHMLETAQGYALERYQFNRPIGSFQGLKHQLAKMFTDLEPCRSLLWYTAHSFDTTKDEFELHSCYAKSLVDDVAKFVARTAIEIHGGMGYTELLGLHLWFKRIEANRQLLGGPMLTRKRAAQIQNWQLRVAG